MKLEDQVCSLELSKRLKELGVKQESLFYWFEQEGYLRVGQLQLSRAARGESRLCSAFTVAELGEMLPREQWLCRLKTGEYECAWYDGKKFGARHSEQGQTEADSRAKMLIYLIENKLVKP